jgi:hypothetical protein
VTGGNQPVKQTVPIEMAEHVLRQGELFLQAQLQTAIAADQRATTIAAFFGTVGTAVAAATIAYWDGSEDSAVLISGLIGAALMIAGACICLYAARPVDFYFAGNHPSAWLPLRFNPLFDVLLGEAENYQDHIEKNAKFLSTNGRLIGWGAAIAVLAPVVSVLAWFVLSATYSLSSQAEKVRAEIHLLSFLDGTSQSSP